MRLFPSTNGWFRISENPSAAAFSTSVGYNSTSSNVARGWASADSSRMLKKLASPLV
jgi:hypothetical protein